MKKEDLKKGYGEPSEGFHNRVVQTLDELEEKAYSHSRGSGRKKTIAIIAVAAALCTFTVTAAATNLFGFVATKTGTYGLNVKMESTEVPEESKQDVDIVFGYMPDTYKENGSSGGSWFEYRTDDDYFMAYYHYADNEMVKDVDYTNVIDTFETMYDGHKTLFITFKQAENTDVLYYTSLKYFDEYHCLVECNCSDYDELVKITEKLDLTPAPEREKPVYSDDGDYELRGALNDYEEHGYGFANEFFDGRVKDVKIGESMKFSAADYEKEPVKLNAKIISIEKRDNSEDLDIDNFVHEGTINYGEFFNNDGTLIRQVTDREYIAGDENHLARLEYVTRTREFYVATIEITAQEDIDNLYDVFRPEVYIIDTEERFFYRHFYKDNSRAMEIYRTNIYGGMNLKKGETVTIQSGFFTENNTANYTYFAVSAVDEPHCLYQNYALKIKE